MAADDQVAMKIIRAKPGHELILANYFAVNEQHFQPWSPLVPPDHHSVQAWRQRLLDRETDFNNKQSVHFIGTDATESFVIGSCSVNNIIWGVFKAANMGYSVAKRYEGQGYMRRIVTHAIDYSFNTLKLHRIMAGHMPSNSRSAGLLKRLGFEREGYARNYLYINGKWEDHVLNALINTDEE